jgi:hypothetical protein
MVIFDEFLTREYYLSNEFVIFANVLSTILRRREDECVIYMLGNTVNFDCPYFSEMGLVNVKKQKQGTIDIYKYGKSKKTTVAVEYCENVDQESEIQDTIFAFNNPRLKMITSGSWEIDIYPHQPCNIKRNEIVFVFYIRWDQDTLKCFIVEKDGNRFLFIDRLKKCDIDEDKDRIYQVKHDYRRNFFRRITVPTDVIGDKICECFRRDKVFYRDNVTGEIVRNYLQWSRQN